MARQPNGIKQPLTSPDRNAAVVPQRGGDSVPTKLGVSANACAIAIVRIVEGPDAGSAYILREGTNSVGRQATNDVIVPNEECVNLYEHCYLVVEIGGIRLVHGNGSAPVYIGGAQLVKEIWLTIGNGFKIGKTVFLIDSPSSDRATP